MPNASLIDKYLPSYTFREYHDITIRAPKPVVYECAKALDFSKSTFIRLLFKIRGLPTRRMNIHGFITDMGFSELEENPPDEFLVGFWARGKISPIPDFEAFAEDRISPRLKAVWNFKTKSLAEKKVLLSTETRVLCIGAVSKISFGLYWLMIRYFSGEIRKIMLRLIRESAQSRPE